MLGSTRRPMLSRRDAKTSLVVLDIDPVNTEATTLGDVTARHIRSRWSSASGSHHCETTKKEGTGTVDSN